MVIELNGLTVNHAIERVQQGLTKYQLIMDRFHQVDVTTDVQFQKSYNGFYRMRQRNSLFYERYFAFMESNKTGPLSFAETLRYIHQELGRVEASFSSKLVATINPNLPIWDTVVLNNLGLSAPKSHRKNRISEIITLYEEIIVWYQSYLQSPDAKKVIEQFDEFYPNARISDLKKIDFVLWQIR